MVQSLGSLPSMRVTGMDIPGPGFSLVHLWLCGHLGSELIVGNAVSLSLSPTALSLYLCLSYKQINTQMFSILQLKGIHLFNKHKATTCHKLPMRATAQT